MSTLDIDQSHLEKAHKLKEEAEKYFSCKNFPQAIRLYHQCLLHARAVQQLSQYGLQGLARSERDQLRSEEDGETEEKKRNRMNSTTRGEEMKEEAISLTIKCYNKLAACILDGENRDEKDYLRAVLTINSSSKKARYRKGIALQRANQYEKAIEEFKQCGDHYFDATKLITDCELSLAEDRKKRDELIQRNFARAQARDNARQQNQQNGHGGGDGGAMIGATMNGCCANGPSTSGLN